MTVRVFVPDIPEFSAIVSAAKDAGGCRVQAPRQGYWQIEGDAELRFDRRQMKLGPALWNSLLSGGFCGRIAEYGREQLVIKSVD